MSNSKSILIVTAHPDDEAIFFAGLIQSSQAERITVLCVTDGNADNNGAVRANQFQTAVDRLGVTDSKMMGYPDIYEQRLDVVKLSEEIAELVDQYDEVYTHGIIGEYGHPHHQDVSYAVHKGVAGKTPVWSIAYNCFPDQEIKLSLEHYQIKSEVLSQVYMAETRRFVNFIQSYWYEGFSNISIEEVEALYAFFVDGRKPIMASLDKYSWYWPYLDFNHGEVAPRPF